MTTQADIKLVIDQLDQIAYGDYDADAIESAITTLETLGNQVAKQAVVIEKLHMVIKAVEIDSDECMDFDECTAMMIPIDTYHQLVEAIPTDSTQVLQDWLDAKLGAPRSYLYKHHYYDGSFIFSPKPTFNGTNAIESIPLFKKPEILK